MARDRSNRIRPTGPGSDPDYRHISPGPAWEAPVPAPDSPMSIPYRGAEMHGVPHTVNEEDYRAYQQKDDMMVTGEPVIPRPVNEIVPIPVRIIEDGDDTPTERPDAGFCDKFTASRAEHVTQPFLLFGEDKGRSSLVINNRSAGTQIFYIGFDEGLNADVHSWDLKPGETITINNTAPVWALASAIDGVLRIIGDRYIERDTRK